MPDTFTEVRYLQSCTEQNAKNHKRAEAADGRASDDVGLAGFLRHAMKAELHNLIVSQSCTGLCIGPLPLQEIKSLSSGMQSIQLAHTETNSDNEGDDDIRR